MATRGPKKQELLDMLYHIAEVQLRGLEGLAEDDDYSEGERIERMAIMGAMLKPLDVYLRTMPLFSDYEAIYDEALAALKTHEHLGCPCTLCDVLQ